MSSTTSITVKNDTHPGTETVHVAMFARSRNALLRIGDLWWRVVRLDVETPTVTFSVDPSHIGAGAQDSDGNYMAPQRERPGQRFEVVMAPSGHVLRATAEPASRPGALEVANRIRRRIDVLGYLDGAALTRASGVDPDQSGHIAPHTPLYVAVVSASVQATTPVVSSELASDPVAIPLTGGTTLTLSVTRGGTEPDRPFSIAVTTRATTPPTDHRSDEAQGARDQNRSEREQHQDEEQEQSERHQEHGRQIDDRSREGATTEEPNHTRPGDEAATLPLAFGALVSAAFRAKVVQVAREVELDPNDLMAIMYFESHLRPDTQNRASGATGLIQFLPATARSLGTSVDALLQMTGVEQLVVVERYFLPYKGRMRTLGDAYMAVLYPRAIGEPPGFVLFRRDTVAYRENRTLDKTDQGFVTKADATAKVRAALTLGLRETA